MIGVRREARLRAILAGLVMVGTVFPRIVALDAFAIQDETLWVNRGSLYLQAVAARDWDLLHTYPPFSLHPGATLLGIIGPITSAYASVQGLAGPVETWSLDDQRGVAAHVRGGLGAVTAVLLVALYVLVLQTSFFRSRPVWAAAIVLFAGLEPWVLGMSRAVHLDALLSLFLLLATVVSVLAFERPRWWLAAAAGALWGLAFMTKSPAVIFLPIVLLPLILRPLRHWRQTMGLLVSWAVAALATIVIVWPPMWFNPILRLIDILADMFSHVEAPEVYLWPSPHPPLFLTLLSITALPGIILYLADRIWTLLRTRSLTSHLLPDLWILGGLLFALLLVAAGGDHARKNLPALAFLALPGALGWLAAARRGRVPASVAAVLLLVVQGALLWLWFPHLSSFHNPLLNTPEGKRLLVDIGNGTRLVADYFNAKPTPTVFATNLPGLIQPYLNEDRRDTVRRLPRSGRLENLDDDIEYLVIPESFPARVNFDASAKALIADTRDLKPETVLRVRDVPLFSIVRVK